MGSRRPNANAWRNHVEGIKVVFVRVDDDIYRQVRVKDAVIRLLVHLARFMNEDMTVSRPRHLIAKALGVSEATVKRRIKAAHDLGLLTTIRRGQKHVTAVYRCHYAMKEHESQRVRNDPLSNVSAGQHSDPPTVDNPRPFTAHEDCGGYGCRDCCENVIPITRRSA